MAKTAYRTLHPDAFQPSNALQIARCKTIEDEAQTEYEFEAVRLGLVDSADIEDSHRLRSQMSGLIDKHVALETE